MNMNMSNNELCFIIMAHGVNKLKTRENSHTIDTEQAGSWYNNHSENVSP
jgi:hypothetical protein